MVYELYLDVLFGHLFIIELAVLAGATALLRRRCSAWRVIGCAVATTAAQCAALLLFNRWWYTFSVCLFLQPLTVWLLFAERTLRAFFTDLAACFLLLLFAGGLLGWLYGDGHGLFGYEAAIGITVSLMALGVVVVREKRKEWKRHYGLVLIHRGRKLQLKALSDSGNLLVDPYTGRSVSMVDRKDLEELGDACPVRLVPFESLGCERGLLPVVTVDCMRLSDGRMLKHPALGLAEHGLFAGKDYQMIINVEALNEEYELQINKLYP